MERATRRVKAGSLSGLSGGGAAASGAVSVRRQRSLEWGGNSGGGGSGGGDPYSSSDEDRPRPPPLADHVFASLLAQATQQFDNEQRRIYGSENGSTPRFVSLSSPQRQASPFPLESTNHRRYYRRNRNSKDEESFTTDASGGGVGGTLSRRGGRRTDEYSDAARNIRIINGTSSSGGGQGSERECDSPPEPAPPEVPPRGPSLHVALRHRPDPPSDGDRLYLSEDFVTSEGGHGSYQARSPMSSSTTGHSSSSHHR